VSDQFQIDTQSVAQAAAQVASTAFDLDSALARIASAEREIAGAGPLAQSSMATVSGARAQVRKTADDLTLLSDDMRHRAQVLEDPEAAPGSLLAVLGRAKDGAVSWTGDALSAIGNALPTIDAGTLDPNGPIARQSRGQTINPFDWAQELADHSATALLSLTPGAIRNAHVTLNVPGLGQQTVALHAPVAMAMDPSNLVGAGPAEGRSAAVLERALPYAEGPARSAVERVLGAWHRGVRSVSPGGVVS
jgi:hypothetical protein